MREFYATFDEFVPCLLLSPVKGKCDGKQFPELPDGHQLVGIVTAKTAMATVCFCDSAKDIRKVNKKARSMEDSRVHWYSAPAEFREEYEVEYSDVFH